MKKLTALLLIPCLLLAGCALADIPSSDYGYIHEGKTKRVYEQPDTGAHVAGSISAGEAFYIIREEGNWYYVVTYGESQIAQMMGWISSEHVKPRIVEKSSGRPSSERQTGLARIKVEEVNLRTDPVDGKVITSLPKDAAVYVFDEQEGKDGCLWYHVNAMHRAKNKTGWLRSDLLVLPDELFCDLVDVSVGQSHVIALKSDGTVIAGGTGHCSCTDVVGLYGVTDVEAGFHTSFAFFEDGGHWKTGLGVEADPTLRAPGLKTATTMGNTWVGIHENGTFMHNYYLHDRVDDDGNAFQISTFDASALVDIVQISAGVLLMACLTADGRVHVYDYDTDPVIEAETWTDIQRIAAYEHVVGLKSDGTVVAAGKNDHGECDVEGWTDIVDVVASGHYTLGLKADGTVVSTGSNLHGATDVADWTDIVQIDGDTFFSVGRTSKGTLVYAGSFRFLDSTDKQGQINMSSGQ